MIKDCQKSILTAYTTVKGRTLFYEVEKVSGRDAGYGYDV